MVLAAGRASRMGQCKQLLVLPDGDTLLARSITQAHWLTSQVKVVAGCGYPLVRYRCRQSPSAWVFCADWHQGLSGSLSAGLDSLPPQALGAFVLLADQPLLSAEGLEQLASSARAQPGEAWAATYGKRVGVPAWIPRSLWPEVRRLKGDSGAGRVLNAVGAQKVNVAGVQQDVDTPEDWKTIKRGLAEQSG